MSLFRRKPIAELVVDEADTSRSLKRVLGAGDLVMLAIGAVIGAGIFGAIGTAAAGQVGPDGVVIRYGAGPALVFSFLLLGGACALAALCYAELASMIPQAGSAYAYTYATLGEAVAWIIGWDLILEYAVGNVAVAISWGDYFTTLMRGVGVEFPAWLTTGYRTALLSSNPDVHGLLQAAPHLAGIPILVNLPAFGIVALVTWLLLRGARESARANNIMVVIKLVALALFIGVGLTSLDMANYTPFAPNGFTGIHQGAAIVFFAYIGFDAISTAAEETRDPQRNLPIGILGGLAICTLIYVIVGFVLTGMVPYTELAHSADPLAYALQSAGYSRVGWLVALGAAVSMTAVLLVFQYGQPRIFFSMARDGLLPQWAAKLNPVTRIPATTTLITGVAVALAALSATRPRPTISPTSGRCSPSRWSARACSCSASPSRNVRGHSRCRWCGRWRRWAPRPACSSWSDSHIRRGSGSGSGSRWDSRSTSRTGTRIRSCARDYADWVGLRRRGYPQMAQIAQIQLGCLLLLALAAGRADAQWTQFRGPNGSGVAADTGYPSSSRRRRTSSGRPPSPTRRPRPSWSAGECSSRPARATSSDDRARRQDGQRSVAPADSARAHAQDLHTNDPASPTPVADEAGVVVFFPDFGLVAYANDGKEAWRHPLGPFRNFYGMAASPIIAGDTVILVCDQAAGSFLLALDRASGRVRWKTERTGRTVGWATPMVFRPAGRPAQLVVLGSAHLDGYDLASGKSLWWMRVASQGGIGTPVESGESVLISTLAATEPWMPEFGPMLEKYDGNKDGRLSERGVQGRPRSRRALRLARRQQRRHRRAGRVGRGARDGRRRVRRAGDSSGQREGAASARRGPVALPEEPAVHPGAAGLPGRVLHGAHGGIITSLDPATGRLLKEGRSRDALGGY